MSERLTKGLGGLVAVALFIVIGLRGCGLQMGNASMEFTWRESADPVAEQVRLGEEMMERCDLGGNWLFRLLGVDGPKAIEVTMTDVPRGSAMYQSGARGPVTVVIDCETGDLIRFK